MDHNNAVEVHRINELGQAFYNKTLKEASRSVYLIGPALLLLFAIVAWLLSGWSIYISYFLAIPAGIAVFLFFLTPIVRRGRFINNLVNTLHINADTIEVETFRWFVYAPKRVRTSEFTIDAHVQDSGVTSPANCRITFRSNGKMQHVNMVKAFFDDWEAAVSQLKVLSKQA